MDEKNKTRKLKLVFLYFTIVLAAMVFLGAVFYHVSAPRKMPKFHSKDTNTALRGSIVSSDGFTIVSSKKLYKATVDTRNLDPQKRELFVKLFSIYSGMDETEIEKRLDSNFGNVILSYSIDSKTAKHLKELAKKLMKLKVFIAYVDKKNKYSFLHGLLIEESGEDRVYLSKDIFMPSLGYVKKVERNDVTKITGVKGLEKYYNDYLEPTQDSQISGKRDIGNTIILDKNSFATKRIDGYDIHLNISLKLQKLIENVLDEQKADLNATEIIACIMESQTGKIITLASSNRFDPTNITEETYKNLNPSFAEYAFEPGSVMKPLTFSIALKTNKVKPYEIFNTYGGKYRLGKRFITDTHAAPSMSAEDVIVHSSNIGTAQIAQRIESFDFYNGFLDFGLTKSTGVEFALESKGGIPTPAQLKSEIYKATTGYGYGMTANFMQIIKAYNVFNNNGKIINPKLASHIVSQDGKIVKIKNEEKEVLPPSVAKKMEQILIKTVNEGTGVKTRYSGLYVGGKTGTAHIVKNGVYARAYNSSFFGFANDKTNKYTMGVTVVEPKKRFHYFASLSAVPTFRKIIDKMVETDFLEPFEVSEEERVKFEQEDKTRAVAKD